MSSKIVGYLAVFQSNCNNCFKQNFHFHVSACKFDILPFPTISRRKQIPVTATFIMETPGLFVKYTLSKWRSENKGRCIILTRGFFSCQGVLIILNNICNYAETSLPHFIYSTRFSLTLSWRRSPSYRNQSIDLLFRSMDWFLYDKDLHHERVKP